MSETDAERSARWRRPIVKERFVVHTVNGKVVSKQWYGSHRGADRIIADRFERDMRQLDPFTRFGHPIASVSEDGRFTYSAASAASACGYAAETR